jgi:ADP-heptose:LPS heptosyltransferase
VLVLRALGLGDLLTALPALRALREHFAKHEIVLAAPERLSEVVELLGCVDRLLPVSAPSRAVPTALPWEAPPPDIAVNLHGRGPQSTDLLCGLAPNRLLAFGPDGPEWDPDEHERVRWCRLLSWYGIPADPGDFLLPGVNPDQQRPPTAPVVLHPGADAPARRWPPDRFAALARELRSRGYEVVITAGRGEGELARGIAAAAGLDPDAVRGGEADVPFATLVELVSQARALVCGDTGLAHLALALATPSVALYGPMSPALWGPPDVGELGGPSTAGDAVRHAALWHPAEGDGLRPGDPHGADPDERLLRISVSEVVEAVMRVLAVRSTSPHTSQRSHSEPPPHPH